MRQFEIIVRNADFRGLAPCFRPVFAWRYIHAPGAGQSIHPQPDGRYIHPQEDGQNASAQTDGQSTPPQADGRVEYDQYTVQVAADSAFQRLLFLRDTRERYIEFDSAPLHRNKTYFIRVRSGLGEWSESSFVTGNQ